MPSLLPLCVTLYSSARELNKNVDTAVFYLLLACIMALLVVSNVKHVSWILVAPLILWYLSKPVQKASQFFVENK